MRRGKDRGFGYVSILLAAAFPAGAAPPETREFRTPTFVLTLRADTQTLAGLSPIADRDFDFLPRRLESSRAGDGHVHLGDLHVRLRTPGGAWRDFSSSHTRVPVRVLPASGAQLARADIHLTMGTGFPLEVERSWSTDGGAVVLRFQLSNPTTGPLEIGVLGVPMVFDNILTDRSLDQAHSQASFSDPCICNDAGYLQVTRLNGAGPALLVLPEAHTPLEAYVPILEPHDDADIFSDRTRRGQTFEGFHDWTIASRGFADREWQGAGEPWNAPTSITLAPGETRGIGLRFTLSSTIRDIEHVLVAQRRPVAIGIPGYVVATDLDATLFLNSPVAVNTVAIEPAGALDIERIGIVNGWTRYRVRGVKWGRARVSIRYTDGTTQTVSYFVTKPAVQVAADLGAFTTHRQFFDDSDDPFARAPSILGFDRETQRIVTQDSRVWIAGMSDEGGAGSWIAAIAKQLDNPVAEEVARLERVVNETVLGKLQVADGAHRGGVRKSLFYYEPARFPNYYSHEMDWTTWTSWKREAAGNLDRSYDYPHVAIGYWVLYRLARHHQGLVRVHDWRWYLDHAALTATAMVREAPYYSQFGQMEGEVFLEILADLQREGLTGQARALEQLMKRRADHWRSLRYPFGSEMPWDSTGQPEVYAWLRHFGDEVRAAATREVILGYDPAIASWGYNGNARRYWDFLYGGKLKRIERQIHHYGSALNAVPLFDAYRANPRDLHLLRVAYGGLLGGITNIDESGFGSAAFHSWPDQMRFDALTGDYGIGFFGHAYATASYLLRDPTFGWLGFGGAVTETPQRIRIEPRDSGRSRVFIAPAGLWITLAAGKIESVDYFPDSGRIEMQLAPRDAHTATAHVRVETTIAGATRLAPSNLAPDHGYYPIALGAEPIRITLTENR